MSQRAGVLLMRGGLTGAVFAVTKWREKDGLIEAIEKHDVTDQFVAVALEFDEDWWNTKTEEAQGG